MVGSVALRALLDFVGSARPGENTESDLIG